MEKIHGLFDSDNSENGYDTPMLKTTTTRSRPTRRGGDAGGGGSVPQMLYGVVKDQSTFGSTDAGLSLRSASTNADFERVKQRRLQVRMCIMYVCSFE